MPVNPALKARLVQQFQQKQQENSLAAQASIAAEHSHEHPRSSGSKEEAAVVQVVGAPAPPVVAPPAAATTAEIKRPFAPAIDKPRVVALPSKKTTSAPKPASDKQQVKKESPFVQSAVPGKKRDRDDQAPIKTKPSTQPLLPPPQQQQQQPLIKRTKSTNPSPAPIPSAEPSAAPKFVKKVDTTAATTPLEILSTLEGEATPRPAGHIPAPSFASYSELWTAVRRVCGDQVNRTTARLCYQDNEDDWIALLPGTPFSFFTKTVRKVLVVPLAKKDSNMMK